MNVRTKTMVSFVLARSGVLGLAGRVVAADRRLVLTLHRVLPQQEVAACHNPYLVLSEKSFEKFLSWLIQHFAIVSLTDLLSASISGDGRRRLCALTFDDGWEDNFRVAFPILQKYSIPATVFLATGYIGSTQRMPEERLRKLWKRAEGEGRVVDFRRPTKRFGYEFDKSPHPRGHLMPLRVDSVNVGIQRMVLREYVN